MTRTLRRALIWSVMLTACSSQPFCNFADTAPIIALPVPSGVASPDGWGTVLMPVSFMEVDGIGRDFIAAAGGPPSQVQTIQVAADGELNVVTNGVLSAICTRADRDVETEYSICYERNPGSALAFRSSWEDGESCLAVGFAGHELRGGLGFWCGVGTTNRREASLIEHSVERESTQAMASTLEPVERMFVGTDRALYLLDGDSVVLRRVRWESEGEYPTQADSIESLSVLASGDDDAWEHLLAVGVPTRHAVLIGEVSSPEPGEEDATLRPMACVVVDEPGFGGVVQVARLEPGGDPVLLASAKRGVEGRSDAVHIFDLDLVDDPADMECVTEPSLSLTCVDDLELPSGTYSCDVNTGANPDDSVQLDFGAAFDVGNIDDTDAYEVVVGAPGATADGYGQAGAAFVYRPATEGDAVLSVLIDSGEDRQAAFLGAGVALAPVGNRDEPILASPGEEGLLMFLCTGVGERAPLWDSPLDNSDSLVDERCRSDLR